LRDGDGLPSHIASFICCHCDLADRSKLCRTSRNLIRWYSEPH
jgi:hypothetical protein